MVRLGWSMREWTGTHLHEMGRGLRSRLAMVAIVNNTVLWCKNLLGE